MWRGDFLISQKKVTIVGIFLLVFLISLAHSWYFRIVPAVDARAYDQIGWQLAESGMYPEKAINRPGPGYEIFLSIIYRFAGHSIPAVWFLQALMLAVSSLLIYFSAGMIFGDFRKSLLSALFVGLSPDLIVMHSMVMTESLVIFFISYVIYLFTRYLYEQKMWAVALLSACLSIASLTRVSAILLFLPPFILMIMEKKWKHLSIFILTAVLVLTPWTVHNYYAFGVIKPFNGSPGLLYVGNYPGATGELVPDYPMPPEVGDRSRLSQLEFDDNLGTAGTRVIKENPINFLRLIFRKASIYFSFARPTGFWPYLEEMPIERFITLAFSTLYFVFLSVFSLFGLWRISHVRVPASLVKSVRYLFFMAILMPIPYFILVVESRYRFPLYLFMAIFAGYGLDEFLKHPHKHLKAICYISLPLVLNSGLDVWRNWEKIQDKFF